MGKAATAAGAIGAATIYTAGRSIDVGVGWIQSLAVVAAQVAALKALLDKQKNQYDDIANKQIGYVEAAINQYILDLNNNLLPTFPDAYPDVPVAVPYTPVDTAEVVFNQMVENLANISKTEEYVVRVNYLHRINYLARAEVMSPGFLTNITNMAYQIRDLINGKLSTGDVVEILTDSAEQAALTGRIGAGAKTTQRNLGISRMRSQAAGRAELAASMHMLNVDVSPISTDATIHDLMLRPENRMALALQETQLIQNSLQNIANTAAQKPPYKMAQLQAKLSSIIARLTYSANKGNMSNQFVPNYASVFGPVLQSLTNGVSRQVADTSNPQQWQHPGGAEQGGLNSASTV